MGTTGTFTVPADGNWHLSWAYTNGSLLAGQTENFVVYEYTTDGALVDILVNALAIGNGTPTATPVYSDTAAGPVLLAAVPLQPGRRVKAREASTTVPSMLRAAGTRRAWCACCRRPGARRAQS